MLGVGGTAAVARKHKLAAAAESLRNGFGDGENGGAQFLVTGGAIKRLAGSAKMRRDHVVWLAHAVSFYRLAAP
jgi:hypothetical protein